MIRRNRSFWIGFGAGVILLLFFSIPFLWNNYQAYRLRSIQQGNLVAAAGDGRAAMQRDCLLIIPKPGSTTEQDVSVSFGGRNWYSLQETGVVLPYDRQLHHQLHVAAGNRMATVPIDAQVMAAQQLYADIGLAPVVPPIVFFQPSEGKAEAGIAVQGASSVQMDPKIPGAHAVLRKNTVTLSFEPDLRKHHFFSFRLIVESSQGKAFTTVAVLPEHTEESIPIRTANELQAIKDNLQGNYRLMNDIDLNGISWQPIGSFQTPFTGLLDGNGHTVTGLIYPQKERADALASFALFGVCQNAVIRNVCIINPRLDVSFSENDAISLASLALECNQSLIENCGVFGGHIKTKNGFAAGLLDSAEDCVLLHLFNSALVEIMQPGIVMPNAGGIAGSMNGFMAYCANEGNVNATHLTGGLFGFGPKSSVWRCINSGIIKGQVFIGEYPPGALFQTMGNYYISDCVFTKGSAGRAGSAFDFGLISGIQVIAPEELSDKESLFVLGSMDGENAQWLLGDADAKGLMPNGIRTLKEYRPGGDDSE